jgi:hypothetical protein
VGVTNSGILTIFTSSRDRWTKGPHLGSVDSSESNSYDVPRRTLSISELKIARTLRLLSLGDRAIEIEVK